MISDENGVPGFTAETVQDVTKHRAMRDLADIRSRQPESEAKRLWDVINALPAQIALLDRAGTIVEVNEKWRRFALENRNPDRQLSIGANYFRVCEQATEAANGLRSVLSGERDEFVSEYRCHAPDINRWFRLTIRCLGDSLADLGSGPLAVAMHVDITERVENDLQLWQSKEHYRTVFDESLSGIAIVSLEGTILEANPAYCKILGRSEDELREISILSILHPDDLAGFAAQRRLLLSGELDRFSEECRYMRPDGSVVWVRTRATLIHDGPTNPSMVLAMVDDVTARKKNERALAEREQLLAIAGQTARLGGWRIDLPERMLTFSREARKIRGWSEEEQSLPLEDAFRSILPEDRDLCRNTIEACILKGEPYVIEVRQTPVERGEIWIRIAGVPVYDGNGRIVAVQGSVQDITEQRKTINSLEYMSGRLQDVLESVSDIFFSLDRHWRFTYSNTAHEKIMGRDRQDILGQVLWEVFPQHLGTKLEENLRFAMERSEITKFRFLSGVSGRWLDLSAYPTAEGLAVFATDVTDRLEFDRQRAHTDRLASMGEMAASLAHEINQPLSAISMAAENAIMEIEAGDVDMEFVFEKLNTVLAQVDKQRKIIDHVKAFSRLDDHGGDAFDPSGPLCDAVKMLEHEFRVSGIELDFAPPQSVPTVSGHAVRLEQVIVNLMTNARDAIAARSERDPSAERRISISISSDDRQVSIGIADTGGGIPIDAMGNIFEPFFTTKGAGEGTGLGLAVSRSIVNNMGGMLLVENADDGACFTISLPIFAGANADLP